MVIPKHILDKFNEVKYTLEFRWDDENHRDLIVDRAWADCLMFCYPELNIHRHDREIT
jgi:hypothetical protein